MIRLSWRQFRTQAAVALGLLVVVAVALAITGPALVHLYDTVVAPCTASSNDCTGVTGSFLGRDRALQQIQNVLLVVPALIGMFWGAPLIARELESGTFRVVWTQSISRAHYVVVKLALGGLASMAAAGLLSLMVSWWFSPLDAVTLNRMTPAAFGVRGIVPIGYAAFAFALGVTAGVLIRRTIPAMAVTIAAFVAARVGVTYWVRPYVFTPLHGTFPLAPFSRNASNSGANPADWVLSTQTTNAAGKVIGQNGGVGSNGELSISPLANGGIALKGIGTCPGQGIPRVNGGRPSDAVVNSAVQHCLNHFNIREVVTYQPISRYWPLQGIETALFVALALALAGFSLWWVRRRLV